MSDNKPAEATDATQPGPPDTAPDAAAATPSDAATQSDWLQTALTYARRLGPVGVLAVIASTLPAIGGFLLLYKLNAVGTWLQSHEQSGVAIYVIGFALCAGLAILPTYAQAALGGWAFGLAIGGPAALAGITGAALIGYVIARGASGDRVEKIIDEKPKWRAVIDALVASGFWRTLLIVTLIRLPLNSPFAITNLVLAATRVKPLPYTLGTLIGIAPRTLVAVYIAVGLESLDVKQKGSVWMYVISIVLTLIALGVIGHYANRAYANRAIARVTGGASGDARPTTPDTTAP
jgi:uncharacterized membrane protein YdjX (TVP38/TMEM64 family)